MDRVRHLHGPALRYFAAVAEAGSIRAAARELHVASSAVNRQILWLERTLGHDLFDRLGRGVRLTEAGEVLRAHVLRTLSDFEATAGELDALTAMRRGTVEIATVESVAESLLPGVIAAFRDKFPGVHVSVRLASSDKVAAAIIAGEADVGFTFEPPQDNRLAIAFYQDLAIGAVMHPRHPLAGEAPLSFGQCLAYPVCLPARGLSLRKRIDVVLSETPIRERAHVEANSLKLMKAIARSGDTIAFQTILGLEREIAEGSLMFRTLTDAPLQRDRFTILATAHRGLSRAAQAFFDHSVAALRDRLSLIDADPAS